MKSETRKEIFSWIKHIVFAVALAFIINQQIIISAQVPSPSMDMTIPSPCRIIGFRQAYLLSDPKRFDVVVFDNPNDKVENNPTWNDQNPDWIQWTKHGEPRLFVKRIIGLPNETIEIKDGLVYINGSDTPLDEPYLLDPPQGDMAPLKIPDGHYFMMGDNRDHSDDARFWVYDQFVSKDELVGKALFTYFPVIKGIR